MPRVFAFQIMSPPGAEITDANDPTRETKRSAASIRHSWASTSHFTPHSGCLFTPTMQPRHAGTLFISPITREAYYNPVEAENAYGRRASERVREYENDTV